MQIVDVWMQHPTARFLEQPFFESLRRWTGRDSMQNDATLAEASLLSSIIRPMTSPTHATAGPKLGDRDEMADFEGREGEATRAAIDEILAFFTRRLES